MAFVQPVTLTGRGIRLEPLGVRPPRRVGGGCGRRGTRRTPRDFRPRAGRHGRLDIEQALASRAWPATGSRSR